MNRRTYLATLSAASGATLAGCGAVFGPTTLGPPEETLDDDRMEKALTYRRDGDRIATLALEQRREQQSPRDRFPFRLSVWHNDDTYIEQFQFDLRTPPTSVDPPAEVYLRTPGDDLWSGLTFHRVENNWTRIALDDAGQLGEGTVTLETIIDPVGQPADEVGVRAELTLSRSGPGRGYAIDTSTRFEPVTA